MELEESPEVYKVTDYDELLFSQVRGYFRRSERRRPSCVACPTSGSEELLFDAQKLCDEFQIDVIALQDKRLRQRWNEEFSRYTLSPGIARFLPARGSLCDEDDKVESNFVDNATWHSLPYLDRLRDEAARCSSGEYEPKPTPAPAQKVEPLAPKPAQPLPSETKPTPSQPVTFSPTGLNLIDTEEKLEGMLAVLLNKKRELPVVVVTRRAGLDHAFVDTSILAAELDDTAWLFELTSNALEFRLSDGLERAGAADCEVYNGAIRVFQASRGRSGRPLKDTRLFKAFPNSNGKALGENIVSCVFGLRATELLTNSAPKEWEQVTARVIGILPAADRAILTYPGGMCSARPEEVANDGVAGPLPIDRLLQTGMTLRGRLDTQSKILVGFAEALRIRPDEAIAAYQEGQTVLVRIAKVFPDHCVVAIFPGVEASIEADEICDPAFPLPDMVEVGQTLPALVVEYEAEPNEWLLSVRQADADNIQPAPPLLLGGPPWLSPEDVGAPETTGGGQAEKVDLSGLMIPEDAGPEAAMHIRGYYVRWQRSEREGKSLLKRVEKAEKINHRFRDKLLRQTQMASRNSSRYKQPAVDNFLSKDDRLCFERERMDWLLREEWTGAFGPQDRAQTPLQPGSWDYDDHFFETLNDADAQLGKVLRCMVDVALGRAGNRQEHPLRTNRGAEAPARTTGDGQPIMRCYVEEGHPQAARLHYAYRHKGGVTFLSVRKHDDLRA